MSDDDRYEDYAENSNSGKCFCLDNGNLPFKMEITHLQHVPFVCSFYHHPQNQMAVTRTKIATNAAHHPPRIAAAKSFIPPSENPPKKVERKDAACPNDLPTRA